MTRCHLGFCVLFCVLTVVLVDCIRVPTEWPKPYNNIRSKPYRDINTSTRVLPQQFSSAETYGASRYPQTKYTVSPKRTNLKQQTQQYNAVLKDSASNSGGWIPIPPNRNTIILKKTHHYGKYAQPKEYSRTDNSFRRRKPNKASTYKVHGSSVSVSSEHEVPKHIPTKPIYPGEGQWAMRGQKYRPYIHKENPYQPTAQPQRQQEYEQRPDGYGTFLDQKMNFNYAKDQYNKNFGSSSSSPSTYSKKNKYTDTVPYGTHESYEEEPEIEQFIPTKLYTQVRRTEKEVHMPKGYEDDDLRLREVIKDSKIQTVYTEEGYEDGAYDHAGHVKEAESEEGRKHFDDKHVRNTGAIYGSYNDGEGADESRYHEVAQNDRGRKGGKGSVDTKKKPWRKAQMVKDTKKSTVKNLENGESDLEVFSEVKVMSSPTKGNETHKFVKITPKNKSVRMKIPLVHKFAITETPNALAVGDEKPGSRGKRSAAPAGDLDKKFPYYKLSDAEVLDENSPLRYSENLENVPRKIHGDMSFYNSRPDVECPEVDDSVDPVPDRIKNAKDDGVEEGPNQGGVQRLKGLGDKIDCFKAKYFGENPLDNPLFKEKQIQFSVPEVFAQNFPVRLSTSLKMHPNEDTQKLNEHNDNFKPKVQIIKALENEEKISEAFDEDMEEMEYDDSAGENGDLNAETTTVVAVENNTQAAKKLPKNIYDQIDAANVAEKAKVHVTVLEDADLNALNARTARKLTLNSEPDANETLKTAHAETQTVTVVSADEDSTTDVPEEENSTGDTESVTALPLRSPYGNRRQSTSLSTSNYIPYPNKPGRNRPKKKPKRKLQHQRSEVQYKDDIKPSEQLHVLSDILRNIQNSTGELIQTPLPTSSINRSSYKPRNKHRRRRIKIVPPAPTFTTLQDAEAILNTDLNLGEVENEQFMYIRPPLASPSTTTPSYESALLDSFGSETVHFDDTKPKKTYPTVYPTQLYKNHKESTEIFDGFLTSEVRPGETVDPSLGVNTVIDENEIIGLVPPSLEHYRTIVPIPAPYYPGHSLGNHQHNYFVPGLKPPEGRKPYYDFDGNNLKRAGYVFHRRSRRSPLEYKEIRQSNRKPLKFRDDTTTEEPEDYPVPSKYDEGRTREASLEDYDDEIPSTVVVTTPRTTTTEGPPTKSFLEYVVQLKSNKNYILIPDPTTTEKGATTPESATEKSPSATATTTGKPPEFLSFVSQLKESNSYVSIPEKKPGAAVKETAAKDADETEEVEEEEEEEEVQRGPVQNSRVMPASFSSSTESSATVTPDGEFTPKTRSYAITSIDTSKYKTIERASGSGGGMRHGLSSRYNSDTDEIASGEMNTARAPILSRGNAGGRTSARGRGSTSESDELELDEEKTAANTNKPTDVRAVAATSVPVERDSEIKTTEPPPRNTKRRMWVRTQKRTSTSTTNAPDVTTSFSTTTISSKRRRGRTRIRLTTTTSTEGTVLDPKRKRSIGNAQVVPPNHKPEYTPIIPRLSYRQLNNVYSPNNLSPAMQEHLQNDDFSPDSDVETFKELSTKSRHGGNYRSLPLNTETTTEVPRFTDVVPKPFAFYTDPALPETVNQLKDSEHSVGFQEEPPLDVEDLDADDKKSERAFVITVPDLDQVSNVNAMKSRSFRRVNAAQRRSNDNYEDVADEADDETDSSRMSDDKQRESFEERRRSLVPYLIKLKDPSKRLYYYAIE